MAALPSAPLLLLRLLLFTTTPRPISGATLDAGDQAILNALLSDVGAVPSTAACPNHWGDGFVLSCTTDSRLKSLLIFWREGGAPPAGLPLGLLGLTTMESLTIGCYQPWFRIPERLSALPALRVLSIAPNEATPPDMSVRGTLPTELALLTGLTRLEISGNDITGSIPNWISKLESLKALRLHRLGLTGWIPEEICQITRLTYLNLGGNALTGGLPSCVRQQSLGSLQTVELQENYLTFDPPAGCIPGKYWDNCFKSDTLPCSQLPDKPMRADCSAFCGLTRNPQPQPAWFARECRPVTPRGSTFKRILRRTCTASARPCSAANYKDGGGWCRNGRSACCCAAGKAPRYNERGRIVGCTRRVAAAAEQLAAVASDV